MSEVTYTKCAGVDVHKAWCPTELSSNGTIVRWGHCLLDCPHVPLEVACLEDPTFPRYAHINDPPKFVNFSATYGVGQAFEPGTSQVVLEVRESYTSIL